MPTTDLTAVTEPRRPISAWEIRWLHAAAWLHAVLRDRMAVGRLDGAAAMLAELLPWEDRQLLIAVLIDASTADHAELVVWLDDALRRTDAASDVRFASARADAEAWAALASEAEVKAWLLACIGRLPAAERLKFVAAVQRQAVAAAS